MYKRQVNYNVCDMGEIPSGDCFELGQMSGFEIVGNDIKNINGSSGGAHADALMVWNDSANGIVKDNRVADSTGMLLSPDTNDLQVINNLIVRSENRCIDASPNGTSGQIAPLRWTWKNNTVWTCGYEALTQGGSTAGRGENQFYNNILEDGGTAGVTAASGNVVRSSIGLPASYTGWTPSWNTTDYQPTNLPLGYGTAGYRPAPAGPAGCAC